MIIASTLQSATPLLASTATQFVSQLCFQLEKQNRLAPFSSVSDAVGLLLPPASNDRSHSTFLSKLFTDVSKNTVSDPLVGLADDTYYDRIADLIAEGGRAFTGRPQSWKRVSEIELALSNSDLSRDEINYLMCELIDIGLTRRALDLAAENDAIDQWLIKVDGSPETVEPLLTAVIPKMSSPGQRFIYTLSVASKLHFAGHPEASLEAHHNAEAEIDSIKGTEIRAMSYLALAMSYFVANVDVGASRCIDKHEDSLNNLEPVQRMKLYIHHSNYLLKFCPQLGGPNAHTFNDLALTFYQAALDCSLTQVTDSQSSREAVVLILLHLKRANLSGRIGPYFTDALTKLDDPNWLRPNVNRKATKITIERAIQQIKSAVSKLN